ncbi:hypothetical protein SprV_0902742100 [Sparganum proliferum]
MMRSSLNFAAVLLTLLAQKAAGITIQEAETSGLEEYLVYVRDNNFNVFYHAGIALILLYVMLGTLVSTIALPPPPPPPIIFLRASPYKSKDLEWRTKFSLDDNMAALGVWCCFVALTSVSALNLNEGLQNPKKYIFYDRQPYSMGLQAGVTCMCVYGILLTFVTMLALMARHLLRVGIVVKRIE